MMIMIMLLLIIVLVIIPQLIQQGSPYALYFNHRVMKSPHVIDVLQLEFENSQVIAFRMFSRLPLLKLMRYEHCCPIDG